MTSPDPKPMDHADIAFVREYSAAALDYGERHGWEGPVWVPSRLVRALDAVLADRDYQEAERLKAEANYRFMVERAADERLDGYRELGARAAAAERERDEALAALTSERLAADETLAAVLAVSSQRAAEARRLRARVRVDAEDVEQAGVTRAHVEAWLRTNGWRLRDAGAVYSVWVTGDDTDPAAVGVSQGDKPSEIARSVAVLALEYERPGLDILDEMAAMPLASPVPDHTSSE